MALVKRELSEIKQVSIFEIVEQAKGAFQNIAGLGNLILDRNFRCLLKFLLGTAPQGAQC